MDFNNTKLGLFGILLAICGFLLLNQQKKLEVIEIADGVPYHYMKTKKHHDALPIKIIDSNTYQHRDKVYDLQSLIRFLWTINSESPLTEILLIASPEESHQTLVWLTSEINLTLPNVEIAWTMKSVKNQAIEKNGQK